MEVYIGEVYWNRNEDIFFLTYSAGIPLGSGRMRQGLEEKDWN